MIARRALVSVLVAGVAVAACSDDTTATPETGPSSTVEVEATDSPTDGSSGAGIAAALGVPSIEVLTPASGGGERPVLEWAAIDGTDRYDVVALTAEGEPYWAWVGSTNSVVFGGGDADAGPGQLAVVYGPLTWTVAAFGADGQLLALSDPAPLAP